MLCCNGAYVDSARTPGLWTENQTWALNNIMQEC